MLNDPGPPSYQPLRYVSVESALSVSRGSPWTDRQPEGLQPSLLQHRRSKDESQYLISTIVEHRMVQSTQGPIEQTQS